MAGYRWKTGRQRRIRVHGSYSYDYSLVVDLTQSGLSAKVGKVFDGASFLGWALPWVITKRSLCWVGFDSQYTQQITTTPGGFRRGFGPLYTTDGSTTACIVQIIDQASGVVLESFDAGWDGLSTYNASDLTLPTGIAGWNGNDVSLWNAGPVIVATDTFAGTHSGDYEYILDMEEVEWRRYGAIGENELEPTATGIFPTDRVEYSEIPRVGGIHGWIAGGVDDTTAILTPFDVVHPVYWPWCALNCQASNGATTTADLSATWDGGGYTQSPTAMSVSNSAGSASESSVSATAASGQTRRSSAESFFPPTWKLVGTAYAVAFGSAISDSATVEWLQGISTVLHSDTGAFPLSRGAANEYRSLYRRGTARAGHFLPSVPGTATSHLTNPGTAPPSQFGVRFSSASFSAVKPQSQRFCLRGPGWDQFSIYQEQYKYYAKDPWHDIKTLPYTSKGWYKGANLAVDSISIVDDKLRIVTSAAGGSVTDRAAVLRIVSDRFEMRHVGIRIRSIGADNLPFALVFSADTTSPIVGDGFPSTTGADGVWVTRMFDRYDYHHPSDAFTAIVPGDVIAQIAVQGLQADSTYEVEWIRGERMDHSKLHVSAAMQFITDTLLTRNIALKTDASELSFLLPAAPVDVGDNPSSWVMTDLAPAPVDLPANPYDTASPVTTEYLDPEYHRNSTVGLYPYLEGMGFNGSQLDSDVAGAGNETILRAYPLATAFNGYPGAGDILGSGAYGEITPVDFYNVMRSQAFGPVLGPGAGSQEVVLTELTIGGADVMERGRGSADGDGYYTTGSPYGRHMGYFLANWVRAWLDNQQPTALSAKVADGARWWILWRTTGEEIRWPSADINRMWRAVRTYLNSSNTLIIGFLESPLSDSWQDQTTDIEGDHPCVRYGRGVSDGRIIVVYEDGGIKRRETFDEGQTWAMATTINASGVKPTVAVTPTGVEHHFWITDDETIETRILDPQGEEIEAATEVVSSDVADDALAAFERDGYIYLLYKDTGGSIITVRSIDGVTFS